MSTQKRKLKAASAVPLVRVALYLRVSTGRQAEHDLSIPDLRAQLLAWCEANSFEATAEFVEPGASATDDRRPIFQQMIERACDGEHAFDVIAVHSYSRFFSRCLRAGILHAQASQARRQVNLDHTTAW
jgi:site-specific DNA recombinase